MGVGVGVGWVTGAETKQSAATARRRDVDPFNDNIRRAFRQLVFKVDDSAAARGAVGSMVVGRDPTRRDSPLVQLRTVPEGSLSSAQLRIVEGANRSQWEPLSSAQAKALLGPVGALLSAPDQTRRGAVKPLFELIARAAREPRTEFIEGLVEHGDSRKIESFVTGMVTGKLVSQWSWVMELSDKLLARADDLVEKKCFVEADALWDCVVKIQDMAFGRCAPGAIDARWYLAMGCVRRNETDRARVLFREFSDSAERLFLDGHREDARGYFEEVLPYSHLLDSDVVEKARQRMRQLRLSER